MLSRDGGDRGRLDGSCELASLEITIYHSYNRCNAKIISSSKLDFLLIDILKHSESTHYFQVTLYVYILITGLTIAHELSLIYDLC